MRALTRERKRNQPYNETWEGNKTNIREKEREREKKKQERDMSECWVDLDESIHGTQKIWR